MKKKSLKRRLEIDDIQEIQDIQDIQNTYKNEKDLDDKNSKNKNSKKWDSSLDIVKKFSLDEHYNCRIYRNKYKYLKNKKDETFLILPNVKKNSCGKNEKAAIKKLKHEFIDIQRVDYEETCSKCNILFRIILAESIMHCPRCGISKEIPIYSLPSAESDFFVPKVLQNKARIIDWLQNVQGNDSGEPSPEILKELCDFIVKNKKSALCDPSVVKQIREDYQENGKYEDAQTAICRLLKRGCNVEPELKEINANFVKKCWDEMKERQSHSLQFDDLEKAPIKKVYEKSSKFAYALSGFKPLQFFAEQEEKIKLMYSLAFSEYEKQKEHHKNWPGGYAYFLKSLCALLGYDEFLEFFDIRVSNPKVREEREEFRKKVWNILGWEYFSMDYPLPPMKYVPNPVPLPIK